MVDTYSEVRTCNACGAPFRRKRNRMSNASWARQKSCSEACRVIARRRWATSKHEPSEFEARYIPEPNTGCWIWTAPLSTHGYGWFRCNGKRVPAHRFSLEYHKGPIPEGMNACHTCDNRWCVNPDHLYAGSQSENIRDCVARGRHNWQTTRREAQEAAKPALHSLKGI
jgi:hypothetical protein